MKLRTAIPTLLPLALILSVPLLLRESEVQPNSTAATLVIITPHNEAIRYEFERAFTEYCRNHGSLEVAIDWRSPGGTSEIVRYLTGEYTAAFRHVWRRGNQPWTAEIQGAVLNRKLTQEHASPAAWAARQEFCAGSTGIGIDVIFGGGQYDLQRLAEAGILVPSGLRQRHPEWFSGEIPLIPRKLSGEIWYDAEDRYYGTCLTAFGICYNADRLLTALPPGTSPPAQWRDLAGPAWRGLVGTGDPSKSGSIAKCFEMILQQEMGRTADRLKMYSYGLPKNTFRPQDLAQGWEDGLLLIRLIGANSRYFTNSAGKVPMDVAAGDAVAGMCIDFYGRFEAEYHQSRGARETMYYVTPMGGTSISADPIGMLRGAPHPELARQFIDFTLSREGQQLWNYRVGTPGGPRQYALRRLPIRRDLFTSADRRQMSDPDENPYDLAAAFEYHPEWTAPLFNVLRILIRVMIIDCHPELVETWAAICQAGGPEAVPEAMAEMRKLPFPYSQAGAVAQQLSTNQDAVSFSREWAAFFRANYGRARKAVQNRVRDTD